MAFMGEGGGYSSKVFIFNEKEIFKEFNGGLSYREKAIWTVLYFQDSCNNKSLSEFSGKKALFSIGPRSNRMLSGQSSVLGLGVTFGKYSKSENRLTIKMPIQPKPERQLPDSVMCLDCTVC